MAVLDHLSTEEDADVHAEEILNVLRESEDLVKGTADIADAIGMSTDGARNRLRDLEEDNRVVAQEIGSENGHTLVWGLDPDERQTPIHPEIDRLVKWCDIIGQLGWSVIYTSILTIAVGVALWISSISMTLLGVSIGAISNPKLHAYGFGIAGGGGAALLVGGSTLLIVMIAEGVAEYRVEPRQ